MAEESVTFLATFPGIQSAIKLDGSGGARIQLDIPETEVGNFITAMMWRGERLRVTIEPDKQEMDNAKIPAREKRKSQRSA